MNGAWIAFFAVTVLILVLVLIWAFSRKRGLSESIKKPGDTNSLELEKKIDIWV